MKKMNWLSSLWLPALAATLIMVLSGPVLAARGKMNPRFTSRAPVYPGAVLVAKEKFGTNYTLKSYPVTISLLTTDPLKKVMAFYNGKGIGRLEASPKRAYRNTEFEERHYFMVLNKDRKALKSDPGVKFLEIHYRTPPKPDRSTPQTFVKGAGRLFDLFASLVALPEARNNKDFDFGRVYRKYRHLRVLYFEPERFEIDRGFRLNLVRNVPRSMRKQYEKVAPGQLLGSRMAGAQGGSRSSGRRSRGDDADREATQRKIVQLMQQGKMAEAQALMMQQRQGRDESRAERRRRRAERREARKRRRQQQQQQGIPNMGPIGIYKKKWDRSVEYLEAVNKLPKYRTRIVIRGREPDRN